MNIPLAQLSVDKRVQTMKRFSLGTQSHLVLLGILMLVFAHQAIGSAVLSIQGTITNLAPTDCASLVRISR